MSTLLAVNDTFTGPNGTLWLNHPADTGQSWIAGTTGGTYDGEIQSNALNRGSETVIGKIDVVDGDTLAVRAEAYLSSPLGAGAYLGLYARANGTVDDGASAVYCTINNTSNAGPVWAYIYDQNFVEVASVNLGVGAYSDGYHTYELSLNGGFVELKIDSVSKASAIGLTRLADDGYCGLLIAGADTAQVTTFQVDTEVEDVVVVGSAAAAAWVIPIAVVAVTVPSYPHGLAVAYTNNEAGADIEVYRKETASGTYSLLDTVAAVASGAQVYDDLTAETGIEYWYKLRAVKAGETTSEYSEEDYGVGNQDLPAFTAAAHTLLLKSYCSPLPNVSVTWSGTGLGPLDTAKVYRSDDGGAYTLVGTVPLRNKAYLDLWPRRTGGASQFRTLRYKIEAYEDGTYLSHVIYTTQSTSYINATACPS